MKSQSDILDHPRAIAIIGMACRFPGARNLAEFRHNLATGTESITFFSDEELLAVGIPQTLLDEAKYVKAAPVLDDIDQFDARFFQYSQRDAETMDPQHRLFLECAWEALEHAGHANTKHTASIGVFGGSGSLMGSYLVSESHINDQLRGPITGREHIGNDKDHLCTSVSFKLNLRGPSIAVQTACSTSLVAVHLACQSLLNGDCEMALAGGVTVRIPHRQGYLYEEGGVFSPDGHCRAFDADGKGTIFSSGVGLVLLKPLQAALADGDSIKAVIRGSAINNDGGEKFSYWATNVEGQTAAMTRTFAAAAVEPTTIGYVEAHGTATHLGDYIEISALKKAFATKETGFCAIGSVKTNIGHTDAAAGIAGLIKAVLSLEEKALYPSLHFSTPNPRIGLEKSPFYVNTKLQPWPANGLPRRAAVNSLGIGGTNAYVILEEAPVMVATQPDRTVPERPFHLLTLSAKSPEALHGLVEQYQQHLRQNPDQSLADISYTANVGRAHFVHRLALVASSVDDATQQLLAYLSDGEQPTNQVKRGLVKEDEQPRIAFLFTGQGSQYLKMGRELYETQPLFRQRLNQCDVVLQACLGRSLLDLLYPATATTNPLGHNDIMDSHPCGQAVNFAIECALADLWRSWGVTPAIVLGHSLGDFAAAYTAGVLSLEDGLRLVTERGRLMERALGSMVSILASEAEILPYIADFDDVTIGVINGPQSVVISGSHDHVAMVTAQLQRAGFKTRKLDIPVAAHSPMLDPVLDDFEAAVRKVVLSAPRCTVVSSMTGKVVRDELTDPVYWRRHLRNTVRFADSMQTLYDKKCTIFLEIGPKPTLLALAEQCLAVASGDTLPAEDWATAVTQKADSLSRLLLPSLRQEKSDWQQLLETLGELYLSGIAIDWQKFDQDYARQKLALPTYPFQRERYWISAASGQKARNHAALAPLIDKMTKSPRLKELLFETHFSTDAIPFLADHYVYDQVAVPGACHLGLLLNACKAGFGEKQVRLEDVVFPTVLTLAADEERTVQTIFSPQNKNNGANLSSTFEVISFNPELAQEEPLIHAIGQVTLPPTNSVRTIALPQLQERCADAIDPEQLYSRVDAKQIHLGPTFRWFDAVWRGDQEVLARMRLPTALGDTAGYLCHPTLIDACFQLTSATWLDDNEDGSEDDTLLPFSLGALHLYQPVVGVVCWAHVQQVATYQWNIQLLSPEGALLADIVGYQMRPAAVTALKRKDTWRNWLYAVNWEAQSLPQATVDQADKQVVARQQWLIFADQQGVGAALATQLRQRGADPVLVYADLTANESWRQVEDAIYHLHPKQVEQYGPLLAQITSTTALHGIVHLWSLDAPDVGVLSALDIAFELGCSTLLPLVQALLGQSVQPSGLWLVTKEAQCIYQEGTLGGVAQSTVWGMGKVIALEHPELNCVCIDLDGFADKTDEIRAKAQHLFAELYMPPSAQGRETQIALRGTQRYVARLARHVQPLGTDTLALSDTSAQRSLPIQPQASYLITGGLGGLGLEVAKWLTLQGATHVILMGRSRPTAPIQAQIETLRAQGVTVTVAQADVTDLAQVQRVVEQIEPAYPLRGLIHAAGVLDDGTLLQQDRQRFEKVLRPKVIGAWHLHTATIAMPLDFFVLFSSIASLIGSSGQANHAAANAFLDQLAHYRQLKKLPALSINWGAWSEIGAAAKLELKTHLEASGFGLIPLQSGLTAFEGLLMQNNQLAQVAVAPIDWAQFLQQFPIPAKSAFFHQWRSPQSSSPQSEPPRTPQPRLRQMLEALPNNRRLEELTTYVGTQVAQLLGLPPTVLPPVDQGFAELGLDSLVALKLRGNLQIALDCNLPATLIFNYPTIRELVDYLSRQLFDDAAEQAIAVVQKADDTSEIDFDALLDDIDDLSVRDVQQLFMKRAS